MRCSGAHAPSLLSSCGLVNLPVCAWSPVGLVTSPSMRPGIAPASFPFLRIGQSSFVHMVIATSFHPGIASIFFPFTPRAAVRTAVQPGGGCDGARVQVQAPHLD